MNSDGAVSRRWPACRSSTLSISIDSPGGTRGGSRLPSAGGGDGPEPGSPGPGTSSAVLPAFDISPLPGFTDGLGCSPPGGHPADLPNLVGAARREDGDQCEPE